MGTSCYDPLRPNREVPQLHIVRSRGTLFAYAIINNKYFYLWNVSGILDNTKHEKMENPALQAKFSWFSHDVTKIQHWRVIYPPEFLFLWTVGAAKNLYSKKFYFEGFLRFVIEYVWTHTSTITRIYSRSLGLFFSSRRNRFYRIISCACHRVNQLMFGRNNHKNSWRDTSYLGKISVISPKIFFISPWSSPRAQLELVYLVDISTVELRDSEPGFFQVSLNRYINGS